MVRQSSASSGDPPARVPPRIAVITFGVAARAAATALTTAAASFPFMTATMTASVRMIGLSANEADVIKTDQASARVSLAS